MGRKVFVSYKYSDNSVATLNKNISTSVRTYVDALEGYFDKSDHIYKGESDGEDLSGLTDDAIWEKLKDRIHDSSVTIVMISPKMKEAGRYDKSQWIPWEISFSLKEICRNDRVSRLNAVLAIVLPDENNSYDYYIENKSCIGCTIGGCRTLKTNTLFNILSNNMFNRKNKDIKNCKEGSTIHFGESCYIYSVKWKDFISGANGYIEKAVQIKDNIDDYDICKTV